MTVVVVCGSCRTDLRQYAKFCDECGSPTARSADAPTYKQVTVLFADVVSSMAIAAAIDIERLREIMNELVHRSATVVQRYGGTVEYNGDGVMALFGAPIALEDHALRGCLAALAIHDEANRMAADIERRDGVSLRLRVGLNSGRVIVGEIGSGSLGYAATGETVGFAQRMESAAPPGGVLVSESTARLVEATVELAETEWVRVKGIDEPVPGRRLLAIGKPESSVARAEAELIGRRWEMAAIEALLQRAADRRGGVVNVLGQAGIGKSRVAREAAALAASRGIEVYWAFCESHARDVAFHAVTRVLRAASGVAGLEGEAARARLRDTVSADTDPQDLLLLDDLLGIGESDAPLPQIDPEARRRRLTALINKTALSREEPALFVIEDAHWMDAVSESMLTDLLTVIPHTPSMVLITYRPEYDGALTRLRGAQTITLAPLADSDTAAMLSGLLGSDPSLDAVSEIIVNRAAGNPFFAEEMVRELAQRGTLTGEHGDYVCTVDVDELSVPGTVLAAIEARIDRLGASAKRTLSAASVIGARFEADLLGALGVDAVFGELLAAELIDEVRFTPGAEYAFRHPLIRTVAYESQLKSDRGRWHRRVASAIESRDGAPTDENAALIAGHLEAAGDPRAAYHWHMRAATWATYRDISAARRSWERARTIADGLPAEDPDRSAMRIAPRTMLCGIAWRLQMDVAGERFDELRGLCTATGDKAALATGMAGLVMDHAFHGRIRVGSQLASEAMTLVEQVGDPTLMIGLSFQLIYGKAQGGGWSDMLNWSQRAIGAADGDPTRGNFVFGSPLALAFATRGIARYCLGRSGWHHDLRRATAMSRSADPLSYAAVITYAYFPGITMGALAADDEALSEIRDAVHIAERSGDDMGVVWARAALGTALVNRRTTDERSYGYQLLLEVSEEFPRRGTSLSELPLVTMYLARESARSGDREEARRLMSGVAEYIRDDDRLLAWAYAIPAIGVLVETLLSFGTESDIAEAEATIERLVTAPADEVLVMRDIWVLRLRALLAHARGDEPAYRQLLSRYRQMAKSLDFRGHKAWAEAMPE